MALSSRGYDSRQYILNFPHDWAEYIKAEAKVRGCTEQALIALCVAEKLKEWQAGDSEASVAP